MRLSDHFTLQELTKSSTAERKGIKNAPDDTQIESLKDVCLNILEPVRTNYGVPLRPSSGFRCLELNRAIGSSDSSQHVKGEAVDFEVPHISNEDLAHWIMLNLDYDQLILEFYREGEPNSGWVHCSYVKGNNRKKALKYNGKNYERLSFSGEG